MIRHKQLLFHFIAILLSFSLLSCNNSPNVPFPENELALSQPVTVPLRFTSPKQMVWDTVKQGGILPVTKELDINALPSKTLDTSGFKPFKQPPETVRFNWDKLPDTIFNPANLASRSLNFKSHLLTLPAPVKTLKPTKQKNRPISIFDFGQYHGMEAKFMTGVVNDKNGMMWVGGAEGIFRYDGSHVQKIVAGVGVPIAALIEDNKGKIWFVHQGGLGMIDLQKGIVRYSKEVAAVRNNITQMTRDNKGHIWLYNSVYKAVSIIDPETETFKNLDKKTGLSDTTVFAVESDNYNNIWIATNTAGANIVDLSAGKIKYLRKADGLSSDTVTAITKDKAGQVWLAPSGVTGAGVDAVDIKRGTIKRYGSSQGFTNAYTFSLIEDAKGHIWKSSFQGIELIDVQHNRMKIIDQEDGLAGNLVTACIPDNAGRMWIATTAGLNIITQYGETTNLLGSTQIVTMMEDAVGNLWVGTDKGIQIINEEKNEVRVLDKSSGLSNDFVQSFTKVNQQMWVTTNAGLNIIDFDKKTIQQIGKNEGLLSDVIYAVFKDKQSNTWLTGPNNGIHRIDSTKKVITHVGSSGGLNDDNIQDVKQDHHGLMWLATNKGGINVYNPASRTVRYLNDQPGLKDTASRMMLVDDYGRVWIGTAKGLYVADVQQNTLTTITTKEGLNSNRVLSLLPSKESIVVGTNNTATLVTAPRPKSGGHWKIVPLKHFEGFVREQTTSWSTDCITSSGKFLWGDRGISVVNEITPFDTSGFTHITGMNVMTQPQHFTNENDLAKNDTLWSADTFYVRGTNPGAGNSGQKKLSWDSVTGAYNVPVNLHLPYDQNYLQFQFTQTQSNWQTPARYSYILEGIDKKWNSTTNDYSENYLNLSPGKYTFKVSSRDAAGKWSKPATMSFTIAPPWYKTWWAFTLFALIALGILRAYIVYRSRKLKRENKLLEERIKLRTEQLQQSIEDLKSTQQQLVQSEKMASLGELTAGIAHEIQNPLNFVNNFSELNAELIAEMKEEIENGNFEEVKAIATDIEENEKKINHHGKRADAIVKGMLQHSRANTGKKEPTDINALADEYVRLSYHGLRAKDKSFNAAFKTQFDESAGKINVVQQDMGRVLLNLLNNAFYSVNEKRKSATSLNGTPYEPTVWASTQKITLLSGVPGIEIVIKDNGNGVPQQVVDKIFQPFFTTKPTGQGTGLGLSLSYDIIKAHGGELKVETKEGDYAKFIIQLPAA